MNNLPLVTIRINSYNHSKYVELAIKSALNQTYSNIDVVVLDDGSTDGSQSIIESLQKKYYFKFITQKNKGISASINEILKNHTNGKYIIGTASDDILANDVVEKYVNYMEKNPNYGMCYGNVYKINNEGKTIGQMVGSGHAGQLFEKIALGEAYLPLISFMWRTDIFKNIGYYEESIAAEDIFMLYKVSKNYEIGYVNTFAKYYRVHEQNSTTNHWKMYESAVKVAELYKNEPFYDKMIKIKHLQWFYLLSRRHKKEALKFVGTALATPFNKLFIGGIINLIGLGFIIDKIRYR